MKDLKKTTTKKTENPPEKRDTTEYYTWVINAMALTHSVKDLVKALTPVLIWYFIFRGIGMIFP